MSNLLQLLQQQWICPITNTQIIDPVLTIDGHTYQRSAIQNWLQTSDKSPKTGLQLSNKLLIQNRALKLTFDNVFKYLPQNNQKMVTLQNENTKLISNIKDLKQQIHNLRDTMEQQNITYKINQDLKIKQRKRNELKSQQINNLKTIIQNLQTQLLTSKKNQLMKEQSNTESLKQFQIKISQVNQKYSNHVKLSEIKSQLQIQFHQQCLSQQAGILEMLSKLNFFIILKMIKFKQSNILKQISVFLKQLIEDYKQNSLITQLSETFQMNKFLVNNTKIQQQDWLKYYFYPSIWDSIDNKFCKSYRGISFNLFKKLNKVWNHQTWTTKEAKQLVECVYVYQEKISQSDWRLLVNSSCASFVKAISISRCKFQHVIRKRDLEKFKELQYLYLGENNLDDESIDEIKQFKVENDKKVVVYEPIIYIRQGNR